MVKRERKEIALNAKIYDFITCRDRIRDFYFDLENDIHDSEEMKKKVEAWTKWLKNNIASSLGLVDLMYYLGIRSIYADLDIIIFCKSFDIARQYLLKFIIYL